jgi:two-component system, chemotaxis family, protein-glutamate methylesterase/glutaminase
LSAPNGGKPTWLQIRASGLVRPLIGAYAVAGGKRFRAAICIVLHIAPQSPSVLAGILQRAGTPPCRPASDGEPPCLGEVLVAPPDRHLVIDDSCVRLTIGPRENNHRPAVDALFRSAAFARGRRVIRIVLSGMRDDGTAGLAMIKARGGATIVQDPTEALYPGMPSSALEHVAVDAVVPSAAIADAIAAMVNRQDLAPESDASEGAGELADSERATVICPECGGVLSERHEAGMTQWECRVGHRYSPETLVDAQAGGVEAALWTAIRALSDRSRLLHRMADRAQGPGQARTARSFRRRGEAAEDQAELVRSALTQAAERALRKVVDEDGIVDRDNVA